MRLYEIIQAESYEMAPFFLALRVVTQEDLQFFIDRSESFEMFFNQEEPIYPMTGEVSDSYSYMCAMNLVTHMSNVPEEKSMKCAVISVYLLRCLQFGKYFKDHVPQKKKGDRTLHQYELLMLRILHHMVFVQIHNAQPMHKLITEPGKFFWEKMGISLNPNLSLVNHSCDPNAFIFHLDKKVLLLASTHIKDGEEITVSYVPSYLHLPLEQRDYKLLKNYEFQCECTACFEKWKMKDEIPESLAKIPNFEQERCYVVRHGDKKLICEEIYSAKWMADFGLTTDSFEVAQEAVDALCRSLNTHVKKPHLYFVEAFVLVEKLVISRHIGFTMTELAQIEEEIKASQSFKTSQSSLIVNNINNHHDVQNGDSKTRVVSNKLSEMINTTNDNQSVTNERTIDLKPNETNNTQPEKSTTSIIKAFQNQEIKGSSTDISKPPSSPTLKLFSSSDGSKGKKSVLERFDNIKFKEISQQAVQDMKKAKKELVDSMRRFPAKTDMAERMATFQPKKVNLKT